MNNILCGWLGYHLNPTLLVRMYGPVSIPVQSPLSCGYLSATAKDADILFLAPGDSERRCRHFAGLASGSFMPNAQMTLAAAKNANDQEIRRRPG